MQKEQNIGKHILCKANVKYIVQYNYIDISIPLKFASFLTVIKKFLCWLVYSITIKLKPMKNVH